MAKRESQKRKLENAHVQDNPVYENFEGSGSEGTDADTGRTLGDSESGHVQLSDSAIRDSTQSSDNHLGLEHKSDGSAENVGGTLQGESLDSGSVSGLGADRERPQLLIKYAEGYPVQERRVRRHTLGSAGVDIYFMSDCCSGKTIYPGNNVQVRTGIRAAIPEGYVGLLTVRSSLGIKRGLQQVNQLSVIDSDFRGEIIMALTSNNSAGTRIAAGERIGQLIVVPCPIMDIVELGENEELPTTERGSNGIGSTGTT